MVNIGNNMSDRMEQLYQAAVSGGLINGGQGDGVKPEYPTLFVAPLGNSLPDDGILAYKTIDRFSDIVGFSAGTVVLFREDQARLLSVLCTDADVFEFDVHAVYGLPGAEYGRWFEEACFSKPRVSYAPLISEIRISREVDDLRAANAPKTVTEREDDRILTSEGKVRTHDEDAIGLATE